MATVARRYVPELEGDLAPQLSHWLWLVNAALMTDEYPPFRLGVGGETVAEGRPEAA